MNNACANARFLNLQGTEAERKEKLKDMVQTLANVLEQEHIDVTSFKPNHFATLSVYYALFLRKGNYRPSNGLNRWCFGLRPYIPGSEIECEADKKEHLASQCLPIHYDASGTAAPAGEIGPGRAIATAPVTCELCGMGLAGHDVLTKHCQQRHGNFAEYRKRVFYKARETGHCEYLPWLKRNSVQGFQFFRLHSVPSSFNDYTAASHELSLIHI